LEPPTQTLPYREDPKGAALWTPVSVGGWSEDNYIYGEIVSLHASVPPGHALIGLHFGTCS
jgi:hypothetical protein